MLEAYFALAPDAIERHGGHRREVHRGRGRGRVRGPGRARGRCRPAPSARACEICGGASSADERVGRPAPAAGRDQHRARRSRTSTSGPTQASTSSWGTRSTPRPASSPRRRSWASRSGRGPWEATPPRVRVRGAATGEPQGQGRAGAPVPCPRRAARPAAPTRAGRTPARTSGARRELARAARRATSVAATGDAQARDRRGRAGHRQEPDPRRARGAYIDAHSIRHHVAPGSLPRHTAMGRASGPSARSSRRMPASSRTTTQALALGAPRRPPSSASRSVRGCRERLMPLLGLPGGTATREELFGAWGRYLRLDDHGRAGGHRVRGRALGRSRAPRLRGAARRRRPEAPLLIVVTATARPMYEASAHVRGRPARRRPARISSRCGDGETVALVDGLLGSVVPDRAPRADPAPQRGQSAVRGGARPPARRPRPARCGSAASYALREGAEHPAAGVDPRAARVAPRRAVRRGADRSWPRPRSSARCSGTTLSASVAGMDTAHDRSRRLASLEGRQLVPPDARHRRWQARWSTPSGTPSPAMSRTGRSRAGRALTGTSPWPAWIDRREGRREDVAGVVAHHLATALELAIATGDARARCDQAPGARRARRCRVERHGTRSRGGRGAVRTSDGAGCPGHGRPRRPPRGVRKGCHPCGAAPTRARSLR